ncbi:hypothetical protein CFP56_036706 [Quercus suber]|uniref:Uncharacterized protein n=1 Tax=Quercus suber TaxID=58331 RepID=A0AAW0M9V3_QUESU
MVVRLVITVTFHSQLLEGCSFFNPAPAYLNMSLPSFYPHPFFQRECLLEKCFNFPSLPVEG